MLASHPVGIEHPFARRALDIESWEFVPLEVAIALRVTDHICLWVIVAKSCNNSDSVRGELAVFWANPDPDVDGETGSLSSCAILAYLFRSVISDDRYVSARFVEPRGHWHYRHCHVVGNECHGGRVCSNRVLLQPKRKQVEET